MKALAIDLGNKRVGIATHEGNIAFPKETVPRVEIIGFLKKYIQKYPDIDTIIVGLPYDLYGIDTRQLDKTQNFMGKLEQLFPDLEIIGHDERYSSFQAAEGFNDHRDDIAAQCILQSYLDSLQK